jgi:hypothetical protein
MLAIDTPSAGILDDLGFKGFGIRVSLAHGNPDDRGDSVHIFLSGQHRPYRWDRVGDFARRLLPINHFRTIHRFDKANKVVCCAMFFDTPRKYSPTGA